MATLASSDVYSVGLDSGVYEKNMLPMVHFSATQSSGFFTKTLKSVFADVTGGGSPPPTTGVIFPNGRV